MMQNKYSRKYCRQVKKWLPGMGKYKRQIVEKIRLAVTAFMEEQPNADCTVLEEHFGTPQQIAAEYVAQMDTMALLHDLRIRGRIVKIVFALVTTLAILWAVGVSVLVIDGLKDQNGYIEVEYNDGRKTVMVVCEK